MHFGNGRAHLQAGIDLPRVVRIKLLAAPFGTGGETDVAGPVWPRLPEIFSSTPCSTDSAGRRVAMLIDRVTDCGVAAGFSRL